MDNIREKRVQIAQETLQIQQQGYYKTPSGKRIDFTISQKNSEQTSKLITPEDGKKLVKRFQCSKAGLGASYEVLNQSTVRAVIESASVCNNVAVLNFASAKNPGGGFLSGAMAQEEALAAASGLYRTLILHRQYYETNRYCSSMMYTDYGIYSPDVVFFRDADNRLLEEPVACSVLTLPAVNMGQVKAKRENVSQAKHVMKDRMRLCLSIFAQRENEIIILGAWGCGVFGNDPADVAKWWNELLSEEGYGIFFEKVLFAVLDKSGGDRIKEFERVFGGR